MISTLTLGSGAPDWLTAILEYAVLGIFLASAAVLVWGVLYGLVRFVRIEAMRLRGQVCEGDTAALRRQVGFYLLFGLELLIAADVIETMLEPTLDHLAILGGIALIRIVVGYALSKELEGVAHEQENAQRGRDTDG